MVFNDTLVGSPFKTRQRMEIGSGEKWVRETKRGNLPKPESRHKPNLPQGGDVARKRETVAQN